MSYYAVANGLNIGIFRTWVECSENIKGFKGAIYKKFDNEEDALKYIEEKRGASKKISADATTKAAEAKEFIADYYVYTDGACSNNGQKSAAAGIGVYFGENDGRNVSQKIDGKQTNNTAELRALLTAYSIVKDDVKAGKKIMMVSDSEYAINCCASYGKKQAAEGWKKDIPNKELVKEIYELFSSSTENIKLMHIAAHTGFADVHSIGNDGADRLANLAIGIDGRCPYAERKQFKRNEDADADADADLEFNRVYLEVPYSEKDEAKALNARWNPGAKKWWVSKKNVHYKEVMERWGAN